jgi:hypothetical protein
MLLSRSVHPVRVRIRPRAAAASSVAPVASAAASASSQSLTCRRCRQRFEIARNSPDACIHHPAAYTGGEVAKAIGFVRASAAPADQLLAVVGRRGLLRFWDCCGAEAEDAPGCKAGWHVSYDDELNEAHGWR